MRHHHRVLVTIALATLPWLTGCAARGGTPRPFPLPGSAGAPASPADAPSPRTVVPFHPDDIRDLLATALSVRGTRYRAGGQHPDTGFDCSGFVVWVFEHHGLALPRTVDDQFGAGRQVERAPPGAADLVFFETEGRGPSHVGIALGDGRFVHAPSRRGVVRVEALDSPYWARRYLGARRVWSEPSRAEPGQDSLK